MNVQPKPATSKNPSTQFVGDAWVDPIVGPQSEGQRMSAARVRFSPGAHSNWHSHALGQTLHVVAGVGLVQARGGEVIEIHPGDTIVTPPGEWHWHGGGPGTFMTHLAVQEADEDGQTTYWGEHVTDDEYRDT